MIWKSLEISLLKWNIIQFRIIWKKCRHVRFCDFRYRSCSQQILLVIMRSLSTCTALCYHVFWKKRLLLACVVVSKYAVWILEFLWLMQVHRYKYLQDYRRPSSNCKPNEEWTHIALPCYNQKRTFYMKWLIVDRFTRNRLIDVFSWNVWSWF